MERNDETSALVALLGRAPSPRRSAELTARARAAGSALEILVDEQGLLIDQALSEADRQLDEWRAQQITVVSMFDPGYPSALAPMTDAPGVLFLAGRTQALEPERSVAVVGSRQASAAAKARAARLASALADDGYIVTSGLAEGIDTAAHEAALERGALTAAVLGNGLHHVYPRQNAGLQRRIVRSGALISQFWPDRPPARWTFPQRNALMAALTSATVIVDAGPMSGTRVQARAALDQGRLVVLFNDVLEQDWARELSQRPGVTVAANAREVVEALRAPPLLHAA